MRLVSRYCRKCGKVTGHEVGHQKQTCLSCQKSTPRYDLRSGRVHR